MGQEMYSKHAEAPTSLSTYSYSSTGAAGVRYACVLLVCTLTLIRSHKLRPPGAGGAVVCFSLGGSG